MKRLALLLVLLTGACTPAIPVISTAGDYPNPTYLPPIQAQGGGMAQLGDDITLTCSIPAPAFSVTQCSGGGFPYTVPAGKIFCLTHMYLQNKYPWNPPRYGGNMHAVYLQEKDIITVSSHNPDLHFDPPYPVRAGRQLLATISNGQTETQNVWAFEQGYLINEGQTCRR